MKYRIWFKGIEKAKEMELVSFDGQWFTFRQDNVLLTFRAREVKHMEAVAQSPLTVAS